MWSRVSITGSTTDMVDVTGLAKVFNRVRALDGISLRVRRGETLALFGANGAGKTTLLKTLATLVRPSAGGGQVAGHDLLTEREAIRARVGMLAHGHHLYEELTATENLRYYGVMYGVPDLGARLGQTLKEVGLEQAATRRVRTFSQGMKRRLALGCLMLRNPDLLLLDEPYVGLDRQATVLLNDYLLQVRARGGTILLATHNHAQGLALADRVVVLAGGRLALERQRGEITAEELRQTGLDPEGGHG
ncbi:MAG: heme ABC exporter ATP-binding protein CcmA [Deltaproteobacteria bacterium]|nr:heme ABC exporter ATP-binding protein CcmA [Deltaproteobacteria bacterium]